MKDTKIRKWRREDAADVAKALNNKKIQDNLRDGLPYPYTEADGLQFIEAMLDGDQYAWAITVADRAIGSIGVVQNENIHRLTGEMGYYVAEEYWGKGIVTQAVKAVCDYMFEHTDVIRIYAEPFTHNIGSCRVLEKAGFELEGILRKNAIKNGQILDMNMYARIKAK